MRMLKNNNNRKKNHLKFSLVRHNTESIVQKDKR